MDKAMDKRIEKKFELKVKVLEYYGDGKCACVKCGYDDIRALSIDHIDGGGNDHRRKERIGNLYHWLWKNEYPDGFQTLCMNCQFIKRYKEDIPRTRGLKSTKLSVRIRTWVKLRTNQQFNINHVQRGLNLLPEEGKHVRIYLYYLVKSGVIKRIRPGVYKTPVQPVKVFNRPSYSTKELI
tara:strand:+ start:373 stop:915 length:543 start_codon:yes stop_codon:yes gene_type:complete